VYLTNHTIYDIEMTKYASALKIGTPNLKIGHVHRPNSRARLMNVEVRINSDGVRGPDRPPGAARRVVFLGDSLTLGWGVEEQDTFASLLEARLSAVQPTEIVNFGTGNYNTEQEVNLFLEKGLKYRPDQVVVFYFINDAEVTPTPSRFEFLSVSRGLSFFWSRFQSSLSNLSTGRTFHSYYAALYRDEQPGWINARRAFLDLKAASAAHRIRLQVVLLPELHDLEHYPFKQEYALVGEFLAQNGIDCLDVTPAFEGYKSPMDLWVAADDAHPNARAHRMIADHVFDYINEGGRQEP
jgi:lysophospholipase L1-like esterase